MKIIHILNEFREIGNGIVNVACDLACEQAKQGHDVTVVSSGGEYVNLLSQFGGKHIYLNQERTFWNIIPMFLGFKKIIKKTQPDVVHAHMMTGTVLANLYFKRKYKLITTVHNEYQRSSVLMKYADVIVAISEAVKNAMIEKGARSFKVHTIINGPLGSPRRKSIEEVIPVSINNTALITVGAVCERKGSDILLNSFIKLADEYPNLNLYYVGNVHWQIIIDKAKASSVANRIHFIGFEAQPLKYLLSSDIFVLPSRREPLGLVLLEAREAGLPIIASNVDGIPEALDYGKAGLLFEVGNEVDLTFKIKYLLDNKKVKLDLSNQARCNLENFTVKRMSNEYVKLYEL